MLNQTPSIVVIAIAVVLCVCTTHVQATVKRDLLSAPWTAFHPNGSIRVEQVPHQAMFHGKQGVTKAWVNGGFAQYASLTMAERKTLAEAWVAHGKANGLYIIIHVGTPGCLSCSIELAKHAQSIGADAIAMLPPYAPDKPKSLASLVDMLAMVADAAPSCEFWYYHLPGSTGVFYKMSQLLEMANTMIPTMVGIKYVEQNPTDYYLCLQVAGGKYNVMWAQEPKITSLPLGAKSFVLAEPYYAPYLVRVLDAFDANNMTAAQEAQSWLVQLQDKIGPVKKDVMKMIGIDLGPPRLPQIQEPQSVIDNTNAWLQGVGFFNTTGHYNFP